MFGQYYSASDLGADTPLAQIMKIPNGTDTPLLVTFSHELRTTKMTSLSMRDLRGCQKQVCNCTRFKHTTDE